MRAPDSATEEPQPLDDDLFSNVIDENGPIDIDALALSLDATSTSDHSHHTHSTPAYI